MAEHQKRSQGHGTEADGSSHEMVLRTFDRNGVAKNSTKDGSRSRVKACEVEKIGRRLSILEEDTRAMKKALFDSLEERRNLVSEINQQFQIINKSHALCNEVAAALMASLEDHDATLHSPKEWRGGVGLSEIFHHQANISRLKTFQTKFVGFDRFYQISSSYERKLISFFLNTCK